MPIRFACEHCNSVLSVSSRKAGHDVTCPKCRQFTPVPVPVPLPTREPAGVAAQPGVEPRQPAAEKPAAPAVHKRSVESVAKRPAAPPVEEALAPTPPVEPATPEVAPPAPATDFRFLESIEPEVGPAPVDQPLFDTSDEVTWVYEGDNTRHTSAAAGTIDFDRISLPRYVLYGQGVLLIVVAVLSLALGIVIGRGSAPQVVERSNVAMPSFLTGKVMYKASQGTEVPDAGAVVIVVPQDQRPPDKAPIEGLRPTDPLPGPDQPSLSTITAISGDYARADEQGTFKLRVPDTGDYFLLVISKNSARPPGQRLDPVHLAQLGRYFLPAPDLLGDRNYRWRAESIKRDKTFTFTFD